jgi:hypothetical protein
MLFAFQAIRGIVQFWVEMRILRASVMHFRSRFVLLENEDRGLMDDDDWLEQGVLVCVLCSVKEQGLRWFSVHLGKAFLEVWPYNLFPFYLFASNSHNHINCVSKTCHS